jgi:hypothetical protein
MKVIFQDIDGVLNNYDVLREASRGHDELSLRTNLGKTHIERLNRLVSETGAVLVISSTWRKFHTVMEFREAFAERGFKGKIIDATPVLNKERGYEIQKFLDERGEIYEIDQFVFWAHRRSRR